MKLAALILGGVLFLGGCEDSGSGGNGGGGAPFKTADEIEREIANSLDRKPYNDLLFTPLSVDCPAKVSENLEANRDTRCSIEDSRGNQTAFKVMAAGKDEYEFSPGDITAGLSFGS